LGGLELTDKDILRYNLEDDKGKFSILQLRRTGSQDRREDRPNMFFSMISPDGTEIFPIGPNGYESRWRVGKDKAKRMVEDDLIYWKKSDEGVWVCYFKYYLEGRTKRPSNLWTDVEGNKKAQVEIKSLFYDKVFDTPKPTDLIKKCLQISNTNSEIILDFFAGSGTTAQAVMDLNKEDGGNRKYICVQLPELCDEKSEAYKAGYKTIAEISKERIRRAGKKIQVENVLKIKDYELQITKLQGEIQTEETIKDIETLQSKIAALAPPSGAGGLGFKVLKIADSNFKQWQQIEGKDAKALTEQMKLFIDPVSENATIENMVYEFLLKSGKDLNSKISLPNPSEGGAFHIINDGELILILEVVNEQIIEKIIAKKPMKVIALDKLFKDNDQLKTNTVLQMRDAGIEFKTV